MPTLRYSGNGASKALLQDVKGLLIVTKNTTQAVTAAKTLAGWQALINPATTAAIKATYIDIARGFESKTKAAEMVVSNTGFNEKTKDFPPEFIAYGHISYADYQTWFAADGQEFDFVPVLQDGKLIAPLTSAGLQIGFCGRLIIMNFDLPKAGGAEKAKYSEFTVVFDDVDQMKKAQILTPDFTRKELEALVPVGLNIEVITAYESSGGTVVVKATHRATGLPYAGLTTTAEWEVVSVSGDTGGAVTTVGAGSANLGIYTLTVLNTTPKMTNDFEIQAVKITASHVVYLSNVLNIPV
jgi:hypothetical protein